MTSVTNTKLAPTDWAKISKKFEDAHASYGIARQYDEEVSGVNCFVLCQNALNLCAAAAAVVEHVSDQPEIIGAKLAMSVNLMETSSAARDEWLKELASAISCSAGVWPDWCRPGLKLQNEDDENPQVAHVAEWDDCGIPY